VTKIQFSVLLAMGIFGVVTVVAVQQGASTPAQDDTAAYEIAALRGEVKTLQSTIGGLADAVNQLRSSQTELADRVTTVPVSATDGEGGAPVAGISKADLRSYVAAVLTQEREVQEAEREQRREEERQRREEREQELAAMREGPYEAYNLRINSLGKVLGLDDGQKQAYFELTTAFRTKFEEDMKALREQREAEREANGESTDDRRGGRDRRGGGEEFRKLATEAQEQFTAGLAQIFTTDQLEAYGNLPRDAQSFYSRGEVTTSGRSSRGPGGFGGFGNFGNRGGSRGGGGRR